jgi:two-component system sensor histidine kinase TctE
MFRSLRAKLLGWVLLPLASAVAVDAWTTYGNALNTASVIQDRLLLGSARSIAEQISFEDGSFQNQIPPAALELFQSSQPDRIYYRVTTGAGHLLSGYTALARPSVALQAESPYFFNSSMRAAPVRVVALLQPVIGDPNARPVMVEVAQTMHGHQQLAHGLWIHAVRQQLLILALATVFILFGLNRGLRPLLRLRNTVSVREPGTLQPIESKGMPAELAPLVDAINDYIRQLEEHAGAQSIFIQNAAHQLRTPFALLNTQLSYAMRATDDQGRVESLKAARRTLQQAVRLVNQLLTLSAAEALASNPEAGPVTPNNLAVVVQEVFENLAAQAQTKDIDLGFEMTGDSSTVKARPVVLKEMVMNLVDNAIRYTQAGGIVTVHVDSVEGKTTLIVEDNGPGIPVECRERVFERFYRIHDRDSNGSGLGLAIVREFASKAGAQVSLSTPATGIGLAVVVEFAWQSDHPASTQAHSQHPT